MMSDGTTKKKSMNQKEDFRNINNVKVQIKNKNDRIYFKIVPSYFALPDGSYCWNSYDGEILNSTLMFFL